MTHIGPIRFVLLALASAIATYAACDHHANASEHPACDRGALARAESAAVTAERLSYNARGADSALLAAQMIRAAGEQLRAARALCEVAEAAPVFPFASEAEPFATDELDPDLAEWRAVMGDGDTVEW